MVYVFAIKPMQIEEASETFMYPVTIEYDTDDKEYVIKDLKDQGYAIVTRTLDLCLLNAYDEQRALIIEGKIVSEGEMAIHSREEFYSLLRRISPKFLSSDTRFVSGIALLDLVKIVIVNLWVLGIPNDKDEDLKELGRQMNYYTDHGKFDLGI
jgi:hypothetical protein